MKRIKMERGGNNRGSSPQHCREKKMNESHEEGENKRVGEQGAMFNLFHKFLFLLRARVWPPSRTE